MIKIMLLLLALPLQAKDISTQIHTANRAFDAGEFQQAVDSYLAVIDTGHLNGHVFYNLGVAYYHMQRLGESMAAFLAARRYIPRDADVSFNINYLQERLPDEVAKKAKEGFWALVQSFSSYLNPKETSIFTLIFLTIGLILITIAMFKRQLVFIFKLGILLIIFAIIFAILNHTKLRFARQWGAIKNAATAIHSGANPNSIVLFKLNAGAPLTIVKRTDTYIKIELADGKQGWVQKEGVVSFL